MGGGSWFYLGTYSINLRIHKEIQSVIAVKRPSQSSVCEQFSCSHQSENRPPGGRGFLCPQCGARYCSLPVECRVCKLMLISAPQLARSFHHLLPLPAFKEVDTTSGICFGCAKPLEQKSFACKSCDANYCIDCDLLLHESLQLCPSCPSTMR
uniref:TFIIH C1-like domain-containing protein n=1 Tax=Parascaris equorum TaxID=6256 RepID=A0A914R1Q2_PAREQ